MGADVVIAVELNSDAVGWAWRNRHPVEAAAEAPSGWSRKLLSRFGINGKQAADAEEGADESLPSMLSVMQSSIAIMSVRIARSRLAVGRRRPHLPAPRPARAHGLPPRRRSHRRRRSRRRACPTRHRPGARR
jgi:NTE family protein